MYGREDAGIAATMATHHPAETTSATSDSASCHSRRRRGVGAVRRYTSPNAGTTKNACSILARKASPTHDAASSSHDVRASSRARSSAYAAIVSSSTSSASGLLKRNIKAATGVVASTAPASRPPPTAGRTPRGSRDRRTVAYSTATVATPISACGTRMLQEPTPNSRADRSIGHSERGVLSTVMKFDASEEPKKNAFQLCAPAWTAAE